MVIWSPDQISGQIPGRVSSSTSLVRFLDWISGSAVRVGFRVGFRVGYRVGFRVRFPGWVSGSGVRVGVRIGCPIRVSGSGSGSDSQSRVLGHVPGQIASLCSGSVSGSGWVVWVSSLNWVQVLCRFQVGSWYLQVKIFHKIFHKMK